MENAFGKPYIGPFQKQNNWKFVVVFGKIKDMYEFLGRNGKKPVFWEEDFELSLVKT